jgi:hypothetical protein
MGLSNANGERRASGGERHAFMCADSECLGAGEDTPNKYSFRKAKSTMGAPSCPSAPF